MKLKLCNFDWLKGLTLALVVIMTNASSLVFTHSSVADSKVSNLSSFEQSLRGKGNGGASKDFFLHGSAESPFSATATSLTDKPVVHILPPETPDIPISDETEEEDLADQDIDKKKDDGKEKTLEERLVELSGKPEEDAPVLADEKAPKPFKAMMIAMQEGRDDLAIKYARQFVRYLQDVQNRVAFATKLQEVAKVAEGISPESRLNEEDPEYDGVRKLLEQERAAKNITNDLEVAYGTKLAGQAREILAAAEAEEDKRLNFSTAKFLKNDDLSEAKTFGDVKLAKNQVVDESSVRKIVQREYAHKLPSAKDGKVSLFLFFRMKDPKSHQALRAMHALAQKRKDDSRVITVGLSLDSVASGDFQRFAKVLQINLPLRVGTKVAKGIGIRLAPTFVFFSPNSETVWTEVGHREWFFLDEIINVMQRSQ